MGCGGGGGGVVAYPTVNLPTILVPAIVAWQMGMTSCSSASNTLFPSVPLFFCNRVSPPAVSAGSVCVRG